MFNKIFFAFFMATLVLLISCGGSDTSKPPVKQDKTAQSPKQSAQTVVIKDPRNVSYTEEESKVMSRFNDLLAQSSKCEYVFYLPGYSMSTEIADPNQLKNFVFYVANKKAPRYDCDLEVGMAIRNAQTDEIHITIDAVVTKPECAMAKVTFDGKTYDMSMTEIGIKHVMQFINIKPGQGKPINK